MKRTPNAAVAELESFVDAFESARAAALEASIEDFLPDFSHPDYADIVAELLRVDLELRWRQGDSAPLESYRERFADVFAESGRFEGLAFEEYRLRCESGDATTPSEYRDRYGIDTADWPPAHRTESGSRRRQTLNRGQESITGQDLDPAGKTQRSAQVFPAVGQSFLDFSLVEELGRGSFGCVYLARQSGLANRFVALKVAPGTSVEPERLAQLQHTNIVPIYSVHEAGGLQAVCMPFLGRFTLDDVLGRLRRQGAAPQSGMDLLSTVVDCNRETVVEPGADRATSAAAPAVAAEHAEIVPSIRRLLQNSNYVDAVVWMTAQIAAGLAHAHERGILHRDLKPANLLLADDGRPMILDFNLSDRVRAPGGRAAAVGGTLPYMAPEHLQALETGVGIDARSDVYSLGVVLFELLARRLPFDSIIDEGRPSTASLAAQRRGRPPSVRTFNLLVPRSVDAIVARCLAPEPSHRYQTAAELRTDLEHHLADRPLKYAPEPSPAERLAKWARRHPRASSATSLGIAAAVVVTCIGAAWLVRESRFARVEAKANYQEFVAAMPGVEAPLSVPGIDAEPLDAGIVAAQSQLERFGVLSTPDWRRHPEFALLPIADQAALDQQVVKTLYLLASASHRRALAIAGDQRRSALRQASSYNATALALAASNASPWHAAVLRQQDALKASSERSGAAPPPVQLLQSATSDAEIQAIELIASGRYSDALPRLIDWRNRSPADLSAWLLLGNAYAGIGNPSEAEACYTFCTVYRPGFVFSFFLRGLARFDQGKLQGAVEDFSRVLQLGGCPTAALVNRALAYDRLGDYQAALADLNAALARGNAPTRLYFIRAKVRASLGDQTGAMEDFQQGLRETPHDATSWLSRGMANLAADPDQALADFRSALAIDPGSRIAIQNIVHVLADRLGREQEALAYMNEVLAANPEDPRALAGRAVTKARLGDSDGAVADAIAVLKLSDDPKVVLQAACAYALCSESDSEFATASLDLLAQALGSEPQLIPIAKSDPDLASIRNNDDFGHVLAAAEALARGRGDQLPSNRRDK